jgi:hypothetical protein
MLAAALAFSVLVFLALIAYAAYLTHDPHEGVREKFALTGQGDDGQLRKKQ